MSAVGPSSRTTDGPPATLRGGDEILLAFTRAVRAGGVQVTQDRAHDFLTTPPTAVEPTTGETHLRHHISPSGYYRGKKVVKTKE